jgi:hypothetical protein
MNFKQIAHQLASILALTAAAYLPYASADTLGVPSPTSGESFTLYNSSAGSFTNIFSFNVNSDAIFFFTGSSNDTVGTLDFEGISNGASLTSVTLLDSTTNTSTDALVTSNTSFTSSSVFGTYEQTSYAAVLGGITLYAADNYQLIFKGVSETIYSQVNGTIFLTPTISLVPIPGSIWLFSSAFAAIIGFTRRKSFSQKTSLPNMDFAGSR